MSTYDGPRSGPDQGGTQMAPPQQQHNGPMTYGPPMYGHYGYGGPRPSWARGMIETKPFFLTSEFFGPLLAIIAMAIAVSSADNFDAPLFWTLVAVITAGYCLSRGIAKSGTKSRAADPREDIDLFNRGDQQHQHSH
jgi:hypothetical protein